jgi:hypothetical protein
VFLVVSFALCGAWLAGFAHGRKLGLAVSVRPASGAGTGYQLDDGLGGGAGEVVEDG